MKGWERKKRPASAKALSAGLIARVGLLVSLALVLSFVERLFPPLIPAAPGIKLGLPNMVTLFALYHLTRREAALILLTRCLLALLLFGNVTGFLFSLGGGLCAMACMLAVMRLKGVSPVGVSMAGAAAHNAGQVTVAVLLMRAPGLYAYLALLLALSVPLGGAIGLGYRPLGKALGRGVKGRL